MDRASPGTDRRNDPERTSTSLFEIPGYRTLTSFTHLPERSIFLAQEEATGKLALVKWAADKELALEYAALRQLAPLCYRPSRSASLAPQPARFDIHGRTVLIRPFVTGRTVRDLARQGPLAGARVQRWIASLAHLLGQVHHQGLHHGDISPANLLVTGQGELVLLDWGGERTTPGYQAPEQLASQAGDVFALGKLWLYLLHGRLVEARECQLEPPPLALACLHEQPAQRPTAHQLVQALGEAFECFEELIGRQPPLHTLERLWNVHTAKSAVWLGVSATSGQGKTSLLQELTSRCRPWAWGQAATLRTPSALELFHSLAGSLQLWDLPLPEEYLQSEAWNAVRHIFPWLPGAHHRPEVPGAELSLVSLADTWADLLARLVAYRGRLLLVFDDLQWADPQSRLLLQALSHRHLPGLMVVLAWRAEEFQAPPELRLTHQLALEPLQLADVQRWARRDGRVLSPLQAHCIHDWTRGLPLLLRDWLNTPDTPLFSGRAGLLLQERLSQLQPPQRRVLESAAILGKNFPLGPLQALHPEWQEALHQACSLQLLLPLEDEIAHFAHDRVREQLLRDLPSPQAQAIHSRLADYYLQQSPQPTGECVHHLVEAGRSQQAAPMALALARQDGTRIASERSRRLYEIYLQHCPQDGQARFEYTRTLRMLGHNSQALDQIHYALQHCPPSAVKTRLLEEFCDAASAIHNCDLLNDCARECLRDPTPDSLSLYIQCRLYACFHTKTMCSPMELLGTLLFGVFFWRHRPLLAADLFSAPPQFGWRWGLERGRQALEGSVDRQATPELWSSVLIRANAWRIGRPPTEDYVQLYQELSDVLNRYGAPMECAKCDILLWLPLLAMGRLAEVDRIATRLSVHQQAEVSNVALSLRLSARGECLPIKVLEPLLEQPAETTIGHAHLCLAAARTYLRRGQPVKAYQVLNRVSRYPSPYDHLPIMALTATAARQALEQTPRSSPLLRQSYREAAWAAVQELIRRRETVYVTALQAYRERAWLYLSEGQPERARRAFQEAVDQAVLCGARLEEALSRRDWGHCASRLNWSEAREQRLQARQLLEELGAWWELDPEPAPLPLEDIGELVCEAMAEAQNPQVWSQLEAWGEGRLARGLRQVLSENHVQQERKRQSLARWSQENELWSRFLANGPLLYERRDSFGTVLESNVRHHELSSASPRVHLPDGSVMEFDVPPQRHSYHQLLRLWELERELCLQEVEGDLQGLLTGQPDQGGWQSIRRGPSLQDFPLPPLNLEQLALPVQQVLASVLREAWNNSRKHASSQPQVECVERGSSHLLLTISDRLKAPSNPGQPGFGLESMRFRLSLVGGELTVERQSDLFRLWIRLPLPQSPPGPLLELSEVPDS